MSRRTLVTSGALACLALVGCAQAPQKAAQTPVERGKYLVVAGACNDCHTPFKLGPQGPEPDISRMLSGHPEGMQLGPPPQLPANGWGFAGSLTNTAWAGPWGISYTANLTPDEETGIGAWSEQNFIDAMRKGQHLGGGRPILPPMPWMWIGKLSDDDLKAVFAYLKSVKPIKNHVPDPVINEPPPAK